jgi:hypothetical protein
VLGVGLLSQASVIMLSLGLNSPSKISMPHESGATFAVVPLIFLFASLSFRPDPGVGNGNVSQNV